MAVEEGTEGLDGSDAGFGGRAWLSVGVVVVVVVGVDLVGWDCDCTVCAAKFGDVFVLEIDSQELGRWIME